MRVLDHDITREASMSDLPAEKSSKDGMATAATLIGVLNPVILAILAYFLNSGLERNRVAIESAKAQIEENSAKLLDLKTAAETSALELQGRVDKVKVISDFMRDLSGSDERRRSLAIEAIMIAMPDEATRLVAAIGKFSATQDPTRAADIATANSAVSNVRDGLVSDMFSPTKMRRVEALGTLKRGWTRDPSVIEALVDQATLAVKDRAQANWARPAADDPAAQNLYSIYNVVTFLSFVRIELDPPLRTKVSAFLQAAMPNSDDTRRIATAIQSRFKS
jgi:hypothetical protein